jgi:hypothetical protein
VKVSEKPWYCNDYAARRPAATASSRRRISNILTGRDYGQLDQDCVVDLSMISARVVESNIALSYSLMGLNCVLRAILDALSPI